MVAAIDDARRLRRRSAPASQPQPRPVPLPPASLRAVATPKFRISLNGGAQIGTSTATQDFAVVINQDDASIVQRHRTRRRRLRRCRRWPTGSRSSLWRGRGGFCRARTVDSAAVGARCLTRSTSTYRDVDGHRSPISQHTETGRSRRARLPKLLSSRRLAVDLRRSVDLQPHAGSGHGHPVRLAYPFDTATFASATTRERFRARSSASTSAPTSAIA